MRGAAFAKVLIFRALLAKNVSLQGLNPLKGKKMASST